MPFRISKIAIPSYSKAFFIIISALPLLMGFGYSLLYSFGLLGLLNDGFTLSHWQNLLSSSESWLSLFYTFSLALFSALVSYILAIFTSYQLSFQSAMKWVQLTLFIPLLFAPLVAAFGFYQFLNPKGFLSSLLVKMHLISDASQIPRLVNDDWSLGIILSHVFLVYPIFNLVFVRIVRNEGIIQLGKQAFILGARNKDFVSKIYIPLLWQKGKTVLLLYFVFLLGTYEIPLLLGKQSPQVVSIFIVEKLTRYNLQDLPLGHAMAVLYSLFIGIFIFALRSIGNLKIVKT